MFGVLAVVAQLANIAQLSFQVLERVDVLLQPKDVHVEKGGKDPFEQSAPINGYQFNTHLPGQGVRLAPAPGAPVSLVPSTEPRP